MKGLGDLIKLSDLWPLLEVIASEAEEGLGILTGAAQLARCIHRHRVESLGLNVEEDEHLTDTIACEALLTASQIERFVEVLREHAKTRRELQRLRALERWPQKDRGGHGAN